MKTLPPILLSLVALLLSSCGGSSAKPDDVARSVGPGLQTVQGDDAVPAEPPLPLDSRVRTGVLDNGLTYYVRENAVPEQRAQLWLGVNAGSVLEDDDQQGLAHFVEHMAFNGTEKYEKMEIVNYLETIGMKFGPDVNAYTSFDETVYMLQVPTDDKAIVAKGLDILHEWAGAITFDGGEVDKERGVVTEEWRLGRGARMRIADKQYPVLFAGSKYAERLPIGKPDILKNAPREALVRYYKDWYRPNLMAVIAVGDFDGAEMEAAIKTQFSDLKNPDEVRARPVEEVPNGDAATVSVETDKEMARTTVSIQTRMKSRPLSSATDYRRHTTENLYHSMFNARLQEIGRKPDSPFLFAYSSTSGMVRTSDSFTRFAMAKEDSVERVLKVLAEETRRVELHGFTASELKRAKTQQMRGHERSTLEDEKTEARGFAAEILRNFLEGESVPGSKLELELIKKQQPTITLEELNTLASSWGRAESRVVLISGPETLKAPDKGQVLALLDAVGVSQPAAYDDEVLDQPLMAKAPTPGAVTKTQVHGAVEVTEWTLSNGATVVVKPTDFKNDEIQFRAFSDGGHSLASDKDYYSARSASAIVGQSGVGAHNAGQLRKQLTGKVASVGAYVAELEEGMWGSASPADLKTFFELIHLRFTAPRKDEDAFSAWMASQSEWVRNRRLSPQGSFFDDMGAFSTMNHLRRRPSTEESLKLVDHDKALAIYRDRFADASDFTFVFVGNIDVETFKPMVETYLGSLPSLNRKEKWKNPKVRSPKGRKLKTTTKGMEPKSYFYLTFHGKEKWTPETSNNMKALSEVLRIRLREVLREDMGGVYGVSSFGHVERRPDKEYRFSITFGCSPENLDALTKAVFETAKDIKKNGIGANYIEKVVTARKRQRELDLKSNRFWASKLEKAFTYKEDPTEILDDSMLGEVSSKQVQASAKKYLSEKQYILGVLKPEEKTSK